MPRQGLNRDSVVQAAVALIEAKGVSQFSMGELARQLHIKTASLYNHVKNLEQLLEFVGEEAAKQFVRLENQAISGKRGEAALFALAGTYRAFAREHYELYRMIIAFPKWQNPILEKEADEILSPIMQVLSGYSLTVKQQLHWQRVLRSMMAGFAFHEQAGGFSHPQTDPEESFRIAIQCVADGMRRAGGNEE